MKKVNLLWILVFSLIPILLNAQLKPTDAVPQMMRGINIGNTMEAPSDGAWNAPIKEYYFDDLKAAGFNTIRIPMNWWNHTSKTAPYTIDAAWLNRVEQVVDWGLARGLFIEMNTHHETQLFGDFNNYLPMYISIWTQIAQRFKGKSDHLLFELLNEPHGSPTVANLNDFNTKVIKAIRVSNPTRLIVYSGNQWANSYNLINAGLVNPNPGDKYLMGYYHSYDPIGFGLSGTGTFGSDADKKGIWDKMQSVTDWTAKSGINAYLGEFGAVSKGDLNSRFRYYATVVDYAIQHKLPFQVWDNNGDFQVYNRGSRKFNEIKDILIHYYPQSTNNFTATQTGNSVVLKWTNRATNGTSILVQRKVTSSDTYITIATIPATATTYTDNSAAAGTYYYRVITNIDASTQYYGYPQQITKTGDAIFGIIVTPDNTSICLGNSVNFTITASSGIISKVDFYEGTTLLGTDNTAPYTFSVKPTTGNHTIIFKATSNTGAISTVSVDVTIYSTPAPLVVTPVTYNLNATATALTATGVNLKWFTVAAGGTALAAAPIPSTKATGTTSYFVSQTQNGCESSRSQLDVTIINNNILPSVTIMSPVDSSSFSLQLPITLTADAGDPDGTIAKVDFYSGSTLLGTSSVAPYSYVWNNASAGNYILTAKATDNLGGVSTSNAVSISVVVPPNVLPTVAIISPTDSSSFTSPSSITITAEAGDVNGSIAKVDFYNGNTLLGTSTSAPYSFVWNKPAGGSYVLIAKATDNAGGIAFSNAVSISVIVPPNILPTIAITAPIANTTITEPTSISITAEAGDVDGKIVKVDFYNGTTLLGTSTSTTTPYLYTIVVPSVSFATSYSITAKATDNSGGVTTSAVVGFVVNPSSSCSFPALTATNWVVRNNWNDHTINGITVTNNTTGIKVTNRAYGDTYVWLISNTQYSMKAGVAYTFSFDIQGNNAIAQTEVGIASGYQWEGPILSQPSVVSPAGYVLNKVNAKTLTITPKNTGNYTIAIKVTLPNTPTVVNTYLFNNIKFCTGSTLKSAEVAENEVYLTSVQVQDSVKQLQVYPNPTSSTATVNTGSIIKTISVVDVFGIMHKASVTFLSDYSATIDLAYLEAGLYFINVISADKKVIVSKLVKE